MSYQAHQNRPFLGGSVPNHAYPTAFPTTQPMQPVQDLPPPYQYPLYGPGTQHQATAPRIQQSPVRPWFRITKDEVRDLSNDRVVITIAKGSSIGLPSALSSKSLVTLTRPDGFVMGTVQYHEVTTSAIDFTVHGRQSKLKNDGFMSDKWYWEPMARGPMTASIDSGVKWYWKMANPTSGTLEDKRKDGRVIARLENGYFTLEQSLSAAEFEEVLVTAVAVSEKGRRKLKDNESSDGIEGILGAVLGG